MNTTTTQQEINGSYVTTDGKAQIDFGITYRNGYPEFHASGHYNGSSGQCIEEIAKAYPEDGTVKRLCLWWRLYHGEAIRNSTVLDTVAKNAKDHPAVSFYDRQATTFLTSNGLKLRATLSDSKPAPRARDGESGRHYRVTLWRGAQCRRCGSPASKTQRECGNCGMFSNEPNAILPPAKITFDFWGSISDAQKGKHPTPYDILACLSSESHCPDTFEDFASEYGYDRDSITAIQTFRRVAAFAARLQSFFTTAELEQLAEIR
jgi:hypothetical protein